jgi:hypothetical protein
MSWDGRRADTGRHELFDLLVGVGLEHVERFEGVAVADQIRASIDAGDYAGAVEDGIAFLRVGHGAAERPFVAVPVTQIEAWLTQLDPGLS